MATQPHQRPPARPAIRAGAEDEAAEPQPQVATPAGPVTPTPTAAECTAFINAVTSGTLRAPYFHKWDNSPFENPAETPPTPTWP
jgi:hypothetical protein